MPIGFFIAPYREHPGRPGVRVSSMDDASPDIGYDWASLDIGSDALVCVNASSAKLANLATTYTRTNKPETLVSAEKVSSLSAEVAIDVRSRIAALMAQADAEGYVRLDDPWNLSTAKLLVALGKLGYGLDRVSTGTFPTTPILDDFTRADSTTSPGPSWTTLGGFGSLGVSTNRAYTHDVISTDVGNYWNPGTFAADCEAYATIVTAVPSQSYWNCLARIVNPGGTTTRDSEWVEAEMLETDLNIYDESDNVLTRNGARNTGITFGIGDAIGLECVGTVLTAYRNPSGGSWTASITRTALYNQAGNIGMEIFGVGVANRYLDDFGGGEVVVPNAWVANSDYSKFPKQKLARV